MGISDEAAKQAREVAGKSGLTIDADTQKEIQEIVKPLVMSMGAMAITAVATEVIQKLMVTSIKESDLSGDRELKPTE